jgi:hypothetical protein
MYLIDVLSSYFIDNVIAIIKTYFVVSKLPTIEKKFNSIITNLVRGIKIFFFFVVDWVAT